MFPRESDKIEKYVGGLPGMIHRSVVASKPKIMQEATEMAIEVMDKRIHTFNTGRAYVARTVKKKQYGGSKPLCSKCNYHHDGLCAPKCHKCNKVGHFARDYRSTASANNANNQKGTGSGQRTICYECRVQGHFKRECPKLKKNNNRGNQVGGGNAPAKVSVVGHAGTKPDSNIVTGMFLLNNRYASVLFDTGTDRSFHPGHEARLHHNLIQPKHQIHANIGCPSSCKHINTKENGRPSQRRSDLRMYPNRPGILLMYSLRNLPRSISDVEKVDNFTKSLNTWYLLWILYNLHPLIPGYLIGLHHQKMKSVGGATERTI
ncbi:reverse transcriptase domain-containing protein [Tanacetum coccineum]